MIQNTTQWLLSTHSNHLMQSLFCINNSKLTLLYLYLRLDFISYLFLSQPLLNGKGLCRNDTWLHQLSPHTSPVYKNSVSWCICNCISIFDVTCLGNVSYACSRICKWGPPGVHYKYNLDIYRTVDYFALCFNSRLLFWLGFGLYL